MQLFLCVSKQNPRWLFTDMQVVNACQSTIFKGLCSTVCFVGSDGNKSFLQKVNVIGFPELR